MFNLESHVEIPPSGEQLKINSTLVPEQPLTEDILVKIRLDPREGLAADQGRYATFYNMYFIRRQWYLTGTNNALVADRFPIFVIAEIRNPTAVFSEYTYGAEFHKWLSDNGHLYYLLMPITVFRGDTFKFAGVTVPKDYCIRSGFRLIDIDLIDTHVYGMWGKQRLFTQRAQTVQHGGYNKVQMAIRLEKQRQKMLEWIEATVLEKTGTCVTN